MFVTLVFSGVLVGLLEFRCWLFDCYGSADWLCWGLFCLVCCCLWDWLVSGWCLG